MSFRKRNVAVTQPGSGPSGRPGISPKEPEKPIPGVRPSPLDARLTTSTGTRSLDSVLAGHAGLALGTSLLVEESGTTDFGGALLRYYAAEGILQEHHVHVLGMGQHWGRELPGLLEEKPSRKGESKASEDKMKIAWRYERLGEFGAGARERNVPAPASSENVTIFCHDFDLSKRLILPSAAQMHFIPTTAQPSRDFTSPPTTTSPFTAFLQHLTTRLSATPNSSIHRVIVPSLLSPALYPSHASEPEHILQFLHGLRALLREYSSRLTAIITLPLTLFPRTSGLTRWMEILSDGVLEIAPFPSTNLVPKAPVGTSGPQEEPPQGMFKIHRLPIFHEKGGGGGEASGFGDDLAFTLSRRKGLIIKPYSLPPIEDEEEPKPGPKPGPRPASKSDIEF